MIKKSGYSGKPLELKLGLDKYPSALVLYAPEYYLNWLTELPVIWTTRVEGSHALIQLFATDTSTFERNLLLLLEVLKPDGMIWVCWPKKSSGVVSDLSEDVIRNFALKHTPLVDVKVCAVDETWSGLKLVVRKELRSNVNRP
ncbi:MAG: DUF3052 domain-containing protein [Flavobacteriales bacterium]|nr:DUF3052 domain-containing protein [Bacteroidota bacterium]MCB9239603.1 DUF3052 domain-containing protein [Flavobacteriales bacterium]